MDKLWSYGCPACLLSCFLFRIGLATIIISVFRPHWELTISPPELALLDKKWTFRADFISIWCKSGFNVFWKHADFVFNRAFILNPMQQHRSWTSPFAWLSRLTVDLIPGSLAISKHLRAADFISQHRFFPFHWGLALSAAAVHTPLTLFNDLCICDGYLSSCAPGWRMKL